MVGTATTKRHRITSHRLAVAQSAALYHATSDDARVAPVLVVEQDVPRGRGGLKRRQREERKGEAGGRAEGPGRGRPAGSGPTGRGTAPPTTGTCSASCSRGGRPPSHHSAA